MNIRDYSLNQGRQGVEASPPPAKLTRAQRKWRKELGTTQESKQPICGTGACCQQLAWTAHRSEPMGQPPGLPGEMNMSRLLAAASLSAATALSPLQVPIIPLPPPTHTQDCTTCASFSPSYPHSQRGLSQSKPNHVSCLLRTLQYFPTDLKPKPNPLTLANKAWHDLPPPYPPTSSMGAKSLASERTCVG